MGARTGLVDDYTEAPLDWAYALFPLPGEGDEALSLEMGATTWPMSGSIGRKRRETRRILARCCTGLTS